MLKKSPRRCNQQSLDGEKLYRTNKPISSKKKIIKTGDLREMEGESIIKR